MVDFSSSFGMKRPQVDLDRVIAFIRERFGLAGEVEEVGSNQDRNFVVTSPGGERHLVKVDNPVFAEREIEAQLLGLRHLRTHGLVVPAPVAGVDGRFLQPLTAHGTRYRARMMTFVEGMPMADASRLGHHDARRLGRLAAHIQLALAEFDHPGLRRRLQWDMRHSKAVIDQLLPSVADDVLRARISDAAEEAWRLVSAVAPHLPIGALHGDLTPDNVVRTATGELATIDFGDLADGWRVAEIAVTAAGMLTRSGGDAAVAFSAIAAFADVAPLTPQEVEAIWPLVVLRGCVLVVSGIHQGSLDADNDYVHERLAEELSVFDTATSVGHRLAAATIAALSGHVAPAATPPISTDFVPMLPAAQSPLVLDLAPGSELMADGAWCGGADVDERLARIRELAAARAGRLADTSIVMPHGRPDLTRTRPLDASAPQNVPLGSRIEVAVGDAVHAPTPSVVTAVGRASVCLGFGGTTLVVEGVSTTLVVGTAVTAGDLVGEAIGRWVRVVWLAATADAADTDADTAAADDDHLPLWVAEPWASGWRRLTHDPAPLLAIEPLPPLPPLADARREAARKAAVFATAQEHYYEQPPLMVRGWRSHLIDVTGRAYLDLVNNVSSIGHAHPRLTAAVAQQMATLSTNSRFLYPQIADLSERLLATVDDDRFDTVLLVNSGTEAVELALRMATLATGRRDVVALREGYHGWTSLADAVSTSAFDNPHALASRPDWVHIADAPNPYRGTHRGADAGERYLGDLRAQLAALVDAGRPPAAYIAEPILGNAGGVIPPPGYVSGAYEAVRAVGGLAIADEVQVGLGRLGRAFWGFDDQGAVPDIVVTAKALGNVHPIGAVITRREIADALGREGQFFSSAGGSPVSCAAALCVLDVLQSEDLVSNALDVGAKLRGALEELAERHPLIGALHGTGLYQGVELVTDRESLAPAVTQTISVCERMRERGVIIQPASERQNVLKVKPPLTLTAEEGAYFVSALDETLSEIRSEIREEID